MRLYHMTSLDVATKFILKDKRLRLSRFHRLNDPFELMSWKLEGPIGRQMMKNFVKHFTEKFGVLCMSHHWRSPLMWAHYAQNHRGVCLGFDVPANTARQILYTDKRTRYAVDPALPYGGMTFEDVERVLSTKSSGWAYEEEWRLFCDLKERDPADGEYYLPFNEDLVLREIIVGSRCESPVGSFRKLAQNLDHPVVIIKARPAFETFSIVRQMRVSAITVSPKRIIHPSNSTAAE